MKAIWENERTGDVIEFEIPEVSLWVTENPVVSELLDADGRVIRQFRERPQFGFRP